MSSTISRYATRRRWKSPSSSRPVGSESARARCCELDRRESAPGRIYTAHIVLFGRCEMTNAMGGEYATRA